MREERGCGRLAISHSEIPRVFLAFFPTKSTENAAHRHYVLDVGVNIFSRGCEERLHRDSIDEDWNREADLDPLPLFTSCLSA